jgi:hypothetical protein
MSLTLEEIAPLTLQEIYHYCVARSTLNVCPVMPAVFQHIVARFVPESRPEPAAYEMVLYPWHTDVGEAVILRQEAL